MPFMSLPCKCMERLLDYTTRINFGLKVKCLTKMKTENVRIVNGRSSSASGV